MIHSSMEDEEFFCILQNEGLPEEDSKILKGNNGFIDNFNACSQVSSR